MPPAYNMGRKGASKGQRARIRFANQTVDTDVEDTEGGGAPLYSPTNPMPSSKSEANMSVDQSDSDATESPNDSTKSEGAIIVKTRSEDASAAPARLNPNSAAWEPGTVGSNQTNTAHAGPAAHGGAQTGGVEHVTANLGQLHIAENNVTSTAGTQGQQGPANGAASTAAYIINPGMPPYGVAPHGAGANGGGARMPQHAVAQPQPFQNPQQQAPGYGANDVMQADSGGGAFAYQQHPGTQSTHNAYPPPGGHIAQPAMFGGPGPVQNQSSYVPAHSAHMQAYNGHQNGFAPGGQPQQPAFSGNAGFPAQVQPQQGQAGGYQHAAAGVPYPQAGGPVQPQQAPGFFQQAQQTPSHHGQYHQPGSSMSSTAMTPSEYRQDSVFSPIQPTPSDGMSDGPGGPGQRTEPRNFAPKGGPVFLANQPPPRFALPEPMVPAGGPAGGPAQAPNDPFGAGPLVSASGHLLHIPAEDQMMLVQTLNTTVYEPVPDLIRSQRSAQLNRITAGPTGRPSLDVVLDDANFPFVIGPLQCHPANYGVVKLKNIPFATKRAEILAFLGRNSKVLNDNQEPVHIIMERVTSKTNDAYVEFMSMQAAINAVDRHHRTLAQGRLSRLGDRPIEVELSSQGALMKDLFPLAQGVQWNNAVPEILPNHPNEPWNHFKGFITDEEMTMLVKHVEIPQRSPFSRDCPQRPFECMISTLKKLPWYMTRFITIRQRYAVYKACFDLLELLKKAIRERRHEENLTPQLYKRLWTAAMLCPGFTVMQKDNIAYAVGLDEFKQREFNQPRFANSWTHQYTLAPKPNVPLDVLEWYIAVIREETYRNINMQPLNVKNRIFSECGNITDMYWGFFFLELSLPRGPPFDNMSLAQVAELEFVTLDVILRRAFPQ